MRIVIYTSLFPYSKYSEAFLSSELTVASQLGYEIIVVPIRKEKLQRSVPSDIVLDNSLACCSWLTRIKAVFKIFSIRRFFASFDKKYPKTLYNWIELFKYLYAANLVYQNLCTQLKKTSSPVIFYSYWLTYAPIAFAWHKERYPNYSDRVKYISRAHGSDIYSSELNIYLPARNLIMDSLDVIYPISDYGKEYLEKEYKGKSKIRVSRLGVYDNRETKSVKDGTNVHIVSCSNVIPLKRVLLLYHTINNYAREHNGQSIQWTHFGDGPLLATIKKQSENHCPNLSIIWKGATDNTDILRLYRNKYYTCYILLSESEGIPVSIMEAIASGIPIIATNVGGVCEIVNDKTGYLLDKDFTQEDFNSAIEKVINNPSIRESAYSFYKQYYDADKNFSNFYKELETLII